MKTPSTSQKRFEALERRVERLSHRVTRLQRGRRAAWVAAGLAVATIPVLAWTFTKPHPDFTAGSPISSAQVNETVDDVYTSLNTLDAEMGRVVTTRVIDDVSLPLSGSFTARGGMMMLFVSGSAYRAAAAGGGMVGVDVLVDGTSIGQVRTFTNEVGSHKALVANPIVFGPLPIGDHSVELQPLPNTSFDGNDPFVAVALELPR